jgi:hypothetical protein
VVAADPHDAEGGAAAEDTLSLRIACIFVIFFASLACGLIPLFVKQFHAADGLLGRLCRAFSGGIILGLAMVSPYLSEERGGGASRGLTEMRGKSRSLMTNYGGFPGSMVASSILCSD